MSTSSPISSTPSTDPTRAAPAPTGDTLAFLVEGGSRRPHLLHRSLPPDSPPTTFDDLPLGKRAYLERTGGREGMSTSSVGELEQVSGDKDEAGTLRVPFPTSIFSEQRNRVLSARSRVVVQEYAGLSVVAGAGGAGEGEGLSREWLRGQSREALEGLLSEADKVIRQGNTDLNLVAAVGKTLLEENAHLRSRQASLMSRSPSKLRSRPPPPSSVSSDDNTPTRTPSRTRKASGRRSSVGSVSSLFTPTPRLSSPTTALSLNALDMENYTLTLQLTELEADSVRVQKEGSRKLRKLEKELGALRGELDRAETRNGELEGENESGRKAIRREGSGSRDEGYAKAERKKWVSYEPTEKDDEEDEVVEEKLSFAPRTPLAETSTNVHRRNPGLGSPTLTIVAAPLTPSTSDSSLSDDHHEELVRQLMAKIEELRTANVEIEVDRINMTDRLERAQSEMDGMRRRCEDLEDELAVGWRENQGEIGWTESAPTESPGRVLKGNQRRMLKSRSHSYGSDSDDSDAFHPSSPRASFLKPFLLQAGSGSQKRSLRSEMGDPWDERGSQDGDISGEDLDLPSDDEEHQTDDLFSLGALRRSGPPQSEAYEELSRRVDELPAEWADEPDAVPEPAGLLRNLAWARNEASDPWESRKYPEKVDTDFGLIEDGRQVEEAGEQVGEDEERMGRAGKLRRRRRRSERTTLGSNNVDEDDSNLTRRELALRRLEYETDEGHDDGDDREEEEMSDFECLEGDRARTSDYWPVTLRARYAPKMVALRAADSALQRIVMLVTYIRFFFILAVALFYAIWQGPKKTLGLVDGRRRLH